MSADILRRAAKTLRDHAEATQHAEPWCPEYLHYAVRHVQRNVDLDLDCKDHGTDCGQPDRYDGRYVALMHPPVALALADWLTAEAEMHDWFESQGTSVSADFVQSLITARAILREGEDHA